MPFLQGSQNTILPSRKPALITACQPSGQHSSWKHGDARMVNLITEPLEKPDTLAEYRRLLARVKAL